MGPKVVAPLEDTLEELPEVLHSGQAAPGGTWLDCHAAGEQRDSWVPQPQQFWTAHCRSLEAEISARA